ncbi:hypothetical protein [Streptomyces atroolivaceus]|uniref:hypothetical protein n=1 Tax=Streptomyces atroolivaceus TaxID=66869 RepID=UPI00363AAAFF
MSACTWTSSVSVNERLSRSARRHLDGRLLQTFVREWTLLWIENTASQLTKDRP